MFHIKFINVLNSKTAQIEQIHKKEGDHIVSGAIFCVIKIDNKRINIISPVSGTINKIYFNVDDLIKTNDMLLTIKSEYLRKQKKVVIEAYSLIAKSNLEKDFKVEIGDDDYLHYLETLSESKTEILKQGVDENIINYNFNINIDINNLVRLKQKLEPHFKKYQIKLTYLAFIVKAVCLALRDFPKMNYFFNDRALQLVLKNYHNIDLLIDNDKSTEKYFLNDIANCSLLSIASQCSKLQDKQDQLALYQIPGFVINQKLEISKDYGNQPVLTIPKINDEQILNKTLPVSLQFNCVIDSNLATQFLDQFYHYLDQPEILVTS